jgi:hypothetical protein
LPDSQLFAARILAHNEMLPMKHHLQMGPSIQFGLNAQAELLEIFGVPGINLVMILKSTYINDVEDDNICIE